MGGLGRILGGSWGISGELEGILRGSLVGLGGILEGGPSVGGMQFFSR